MTLLSDLADRVAPVVCADGHDQSRGCWSDDGSCCVGARLAHALDVETGYYIDGADAFAAAFGATRAHLTLMLREAGAPHDPFGQEQWQEPLADIWDRLTEMETLPALSDSDLSHLDLSGIDLSHADLRGVSLHDTDLEGAVLDSANLTGADLTNAMLTDATLRGTILVNADMRRAYGSRVNCSGAQMRGMRADRARLYDLNGRRAALDGASFRDASLSGGCFDEADIANTTWEGAGMEGVTFVDAVPSAFVPTLPSRA